MSLPGFLRPAAVVVWFLLFAAVWLLTTLADADTFWLAPGFFLPQFALTAGLVFRSVRTPWPWGPFLATALPATSVLGLSVLFLVGSVLEADHPAPDSLPPVMVVIPLAAAAAGFAWFLSLRRRPRRRAARSLLASICGVALLQLVVSAASLPAAERQDTFLGGLFCRISIAMALTTIVWTVPAWISVSTLPSAAPDTPGSVT